MKLAPLYLRRQTNNTKRALRRKHDWFNRIRWKKGEFVWVYDRDTATAPYMDLDRSSMTKCKITIQEDVMWRDKNMHVLIDVGESLLDKKLHLISVEKFVDILKYGIR